MLRVARPVRNRDVAAVRMPKYDWLFDLQRIAESAHILCEIADVPSRVIAWINTAGAAQVGEDQLRCVRECSD
jgi:hypothetical protein